MILNKMDNVMKNKISYFFIIVLLCSCSNKQSNKENSEVGFFNEKKNINETANTMSPIIKDNFGNTYILDIFNVFSQKLILQSEVFFIDYLNTYDQVFEISLINKLDYVIVEIQNRIGVSSYELFI